MTTSFTFVILLGAFFMALAAQGPWPGLKPYAHLGFLAPALVALASALYNLYHLNWWPFLLAAFAAVVLLGTTWAVRILTQPTEQAAPHADDAP